MSGILVDSCGTATTAFYHRENIWVLFQEQENLIQSPINIFNDREKNVLHSSSVSALVSDAAFRSAVPGQVQVQVQGTAGAAQVFFRALLQPSVCLQSALQSLVTL